MGHVLHLLAALATLAAPRVVDLEGPTWVVWSWGPVALALPLRPRGRPRAGSRCGGRFRLAGLADRALGAAAVVLQAAAVLVLGWLEVLAARGLEADLAAWPGPALMIGVAPYVVAELATIDARARLAASAPGAIRRVRAFQLRMWSSALVPFCVYLAASGAIGSRASWRVHLEEVALVGAAFTVVLLGAFAYFLPRLVVRIWDTAAMAAGETRTMLEELARRAAFRCRGLFVWRTGGLMANAAIVGFAPKSRVVVFSDALLDVLGPSELAAVFAHEMGHAKRRHALVFASHALGLFMLADLLAERFGAGEARATLWLLGGALLVWLLSFRYLSRRVELEADLISLDLMGTSEPLVRALRLVTRADAYARSSGRHFSSERRVSFLRAAELDPAVGTTSAPYRPSLERGWYRAVHRRRGGPARRAGRDVGIRPSSRGPPSRSLRGGGGARPRPAGRDGGERRGRGVGPPRDLRRGARAGRAHARCPRSGGARGPRRGGCGPRGVAAPARVPAGAEGAR